MADGRIDEAIGYEIGLLSNEAYYMPKLALVNLNPALSTIPYRIYDTDTVEIYSNSFDVQTAKLYEGKRLFSL